MATASVKITYQDYLQLPEGQRWEVLDGDLRMIPTPWTLHQDVLGNLAFLMSRHMREHKQGQIYFAPLDVILAEETVVQPDLLVVLQEHIAIVKPEGVRGAPDLIAEVLSPGNAYRDRGIKRRLYARYGVREYWIIDPRERTVEVTGLHGGILETLSAVTDGDLIHSPLLPDLTLAVADLFPK